MDREAWRAAIHGLDTTEWLNWTELRYYYSFVSADFVFFVCGIREEKKHCSLVW